MAHGASALMDILSNIGPVAMGVLVILLFASLYSWTVILGKISTFKQSHQRKPAVYPHIPQGFAAAGDRDPPPRLQRQPARAGVRRRLRNLQAADRRLGPPRNITPLERSAQTAASEAVTASSGA